MAGTEEYAVFSFEILIAKLPSRKFVILTSLQQYGTALFFMFHCVL